MGKERLIQITANPAPDGLYPPQRSCGCGKMSQSFRPMRPHPAAQGLMCAPSMLTGEFATEVSDASGMQLLDVPHRCWSQEVLEKLDIDPALLAKGYESPELPALSPQRRPPHRPGCWHPRGGGAGETPPRRWVPRVVADEARPSPPLAPPGWCSPTSITSPSTPGPVHTFCCAVPGAWHVRA